MSQEMTVHFAGGKRVVALYDGFEIATDQSEKNGGQASAPEPYDLFLASLATCAGAYVAGFCARRDLPIQGIRLVQRWERDGKGAIATITIAIEVPPSFPAKYRDALVRAASQCAVKRTIETPPRFVVECS
jgi:putative redox protein